MNGAGRYMVVRDDRPGWTDWLVVDTEAGTPHVHSRHEGSEWAWRELHDMQDRHDAATEDAS